ncbi:MAG: hypothetical protein MUP14_09595, partial [Dehalococcoidia bacterium]|nr:hypothetical protein [Dehalococcoidia bacterium]
EGSEPMYDEQGNFVGCGSTEQTVKVCDQEGSDFDGDGLEDNCDPDPVSPDADGDTIPDPFEFYMGTNPRDNCPDDVNDPAWPFDINNDTWADEADIELFYSSGVYGTQQGDDNYNPRYDLNADGAIDDMDIQLYTDAGVLNTQCSNAPVISGGQGNTLGDALAERESLQAGGPLVCGWWSPVWKWIRCQYKCYTNKSRVCTPTCYNICVAPGYCYLSCTVICTTWSFYTCGFRCP